MLVAQPQPLLVQRGAAIGLLSDLAFSAIYVHVFLVTFAGPAERTTAPCASASPPGSFCTIYSTRPSSAATTSSAPSRATSSVH